MGLLVDSSYNFELGIIMYINEVVGFLFFFNYEEILNIEFPCSSYF
jgi:hypothetical protein